MTVQEYAAVCIKFAEASKGWAALDDSQLVTTHDRSWEMTADNQNGGLDVSWAFHQDEAYIKENAGQKLLDHVKQEMEYAAMSPLDAQEIAMQLKEMLAPGVYSTSEIK